jgi:hypothetical protein
MPPKLLTFPSSNASRSAAVHVCGPACPPAASARPTPASPTSGAGIPKASLTRRANVWSPESRSRSIAGLRNNNFSVLTVYLKARRGRDRVSLALVAAVPLSMDGPSVCEIKDAVALAASATPAACLADIVGSKAGGRTVAELTRQRNAGWPTLGLGHGSLCINVDRHATINPEKPSARKGSLIRLPFSP